VIRLLGPVLVVAACSGNGNPCEADPFAALSTSIVTLGAACYQRWSVRDDALRTLHGAGCRAWLQRRRRQLPGLLDATGDAW
jgi:hypothetical protein